MQRMLGVIVAVACCWQAGGVQAEPRSDRAPGAPPQTASAGLSTTAGWPVVPAEQLAGKRARADTVSNTMDLNGAVSGNSAINVVTGANAISSGSFSNAAGLPVAIQNSGANVLIQNATIINVQMK